jgi:hypothetical protein
MDGVIWMTARKKRVREIKGHYARGKGRERERERERDFIG